MKKIDDETDVIISVEGETFEEVARRVAESRHRWYLSNIWGIKGEKIPAIKRYDIEKIEKKYNENIKK